VSWNGYIQDPVSAEDITVENASFGFGAYEDASPEVKDQIDLAFAKAVSIAHSGAVGEDKLFRVYVSGHANPGHEQADGWANDTITVTVTQA